MSFFFADNPTGPLFRGSTVSYGAAMQIILINKNDIYKKQIVLGYLIFNSMDINYSNY